MISGKKVTDYLFVNPDVTEHISHEDYVVQPGTALLKFCLEAQDSIEYCKSYFPKHAGNHKLTQKSIMSIQHIVNSTVALMMGHLETHQKYLFAGTFERTIYFKNFNSRAFFDEVGMKEKDGIGIAPNHLLGYRGESLIAGVLLANNIGSWHDSSKVNRYFKAFGLKTNYFSNDDIHDLNLIWQLRHSIVHTAATLTKSDAQKLEGLNFLAGKRIVFTNKFVYELSKNLHSVIFNANNRLKTEVRSLLRDDLTPSEKTKILEFYDVKSKNSVWLK